MSVDFPNEAARCQRFSSRRSQSSFARAGKDGPAAMRRRIISAATGGGAIYGRGAGVGRGRAIGVARGVAEGVAVGVGDGPA